MYISEVVLANHVGSQQHTCSAVCLYLSLVRKASSISNGAADRLGRV